MISPHQSLAFKEPSFYLRLTLLPFHFFLLATFPAFLTGAWADSLDSTEGRYYSRNTELSAYRFGFDTPPSPCPCLDPNFDARRVYPRGVYPASRRQNLGSGYYVRSQVSGGHSAWDDLKEYALDFLPGMIGDDSLNTPSVMPYGQAKLPARVLRNSYYGGPSAYGYASGSPEQLTRRVQAISDALVNSVAGWLKYYFGGQPAYADYDFGGTGTYFLGGSSDEVDFANSERIAARVYRDGLVHF